MASRPDFPRADSAAFRQARMAAVTARQQAAASFTPPTPPPIVIVQQPPPQPQQQGAPLFSFDSVFGLGPPRPQGASLVGTVNNAVNAVVLVAFVILFVLILVVSLAGGGTRGSNPAPPSAPAPNIEDYVKQGRGGPAPSSASSAPAGSAPLTKRALLLGLNYTNSPYQLRGCIEDVRNLSEALVAKDAFPPQGISVLTDATELKPTRANILGALTAFAKTIAPGHVGLVWYSGHGTQDRDPATGRTEEAWCPLDFTTAGLILGPAVRAALLDGLAPGARVFVGSDSCHSGTLLNLKRCTQKDASVPRAVHELELGGGGAAAADPADKALVPLRGGAASFKPDASAPCYVRLAFQARYRPRANHARVLERAVKALPPTAVADALKAPPLTLINESRYTETAADVIMLSGCADAQTSADAWEDNEAQGACTWAFLRARAMLPPDATLNAALVLTRAILRAGGYAQTPQVSLGNSRLSLSTKLRDFFAGGAL